MAAFVNVERFLFIIHQDSSAVLCNYISLKCYQLHRSILMRNK